MDLLLDIVSDERSGQIAVRRVLLVRQHEEPSATRHHAMVLIPGIFYRIHTTNAIAAKKNYLKNLSLLQFE